jgi:hypothetical protein
MSGQIHGLLEVSLEEAISSLSAHAKNQGLNPSASRVSAMLCDEIEKGSLKATRLVRDLNGQIVASKTLIDPGLLLEFGQQWLSEHGLHVEPMTGDYPDFPSYDADLVICAWLEEVLPEIRAGLSAMYERSDYKTHRVEAVVAALVCPDVLAGGNAVREYRKEMLSFARSSSPESAIADKRIPSPRAERTYLNIIGALVALLLGKSPAGKPHSLFKTQESIIDALVRVLP